jgi:selenide,water dikinase
VAALAAAGLVPGGSRANLDWVAPRTVFPEGMAPAERLVLADAQTNGGLLAAVRPERAPELLAALREAGVEAAAVGEVLPAGDAPGLEVV